MAGKTDLAGSQDLANMHKEVRDWLEKIYCNETIPQYEINERTLEILMKLKQRNEERDGEAQIVIKDYQEKTEEYHAEAERLSAILQIIGLSSTNLSQSGNVSLRALAMAALTLGIKDASITSYFQALTKLATDSLDVEEQRFHDQRTISKLFSRTKEALMKVETLKRSLEQMNEEAKTVGPEMNKKMRQSGFLQNKTKDYSKQMQELKIELEKNGVDPTIYHQNLVKLAEELENIQNKIVPLKSKLDSYRSLPPNISLARVKIEEMRRELATVEAELSKNIDLMHL